MCANYFSAEKITEVGAKAPLAHDAVRVFPDWYKPYGFNYHSDGWMLLILGVFALYGYSYNADICEQKGRRTRKLFESNLPTQYEKFTMVKGSRNAVDRLAAGDASFEKFTHPKERAAVHH